MANVRCPCTSLYFPCLFLVVFSMNILYVFEFTVGLPYYDYHTFCFLLIKNCLVVSEKRICFTYLNSEELAKGIHPKCWLARTLYFISLHRTVTFLFWMSMFDFCFTSQLQNNNDLPPMHYYSRIYFLEDGTCNAWVNWNWFGSKTQRSNWSIPHQRWYMAFTFNRHHLVFEPEKVAAN